MITADRYQKIESWFRNHPVHFQILKILNTGLPKLVYLLYPVLIGILLFQKDVRVIRCVFVPAVVFISGSVLRRLLNCPRPYEAMPINPLISRDKQGQSFPSRHMLSASVICAMSWYLYPVLGMILCSITLLIGITRVLAGIHFPRDIIAGILFGGILGYIGFFLI